MKKNLGAQIWVQIYVFCHFLKFGSLVFLEIAYNDSLQQCLTTGRYFRPKLVRWNESVYCTPIDRALKMQFNEGSRSFIRPTIPMKVFVKSVVLFFGQNKYTNIRRFSTIFRHKTRIFSLQKVQKIQFWVKWLHNIYLTKAKSRTLSLFIENTQI